MEQQMVILLVGMGVFGLLIGFLIGKSFGASNSSFDHKELEEYKAAVSEHFGKTADLVDNLTNSYKDVFEHLGTSARALLSEEEVKKHLQSRAEKAVTLTYIQDEKTKKVKATEKTVEPSTNKATQEKKPLELSEKQKEKLQSELEKISDKVEKTEANKAKS